VSKLKGFVLLAVLLCASGTAAAQDAAAPPSACQLRLAKLAEFQPLPVVAGPGECGAVDAVMLQSVILPDQAKVAVAPPATLRCTTAEEVARWLREDVAPAALKLGAPLRGLDEAGSYECRGFNRVGDATLSEHGRANALDVRALRLANGEVIGLTDVSIAKDWREGLRASACARFTTCPGSDGYHEEHIHLDLAERRGGCASGMCASRSRRRRGRTRTPRGLRQRSRSRCRCRARVLAWFARLVRPSASLVKGVHGSKVAQLRAPTVAVRFAFAHRCLPACEHITKFRFRGQTRRSAVCGTKTANDLDAVMGPALSGQLMWLSSDR
jgi:hypothetical protein